MKQIKYNFILLILCTLLISCKDNTVDTSSTETVIFQYDGLIEDIGGDCSAVQVRTRSYGTFDFSSSERIKLDFNGMSDADLSSVSFYYVVNEEVFDIINLSDRDQINVTKTVELDSPRTNAEIFSRVTLKSSVCTGQIFFLSLRDLKIYTITD